MCVHKYTCVSIVLVQDTERDKRALVHPVLILQSIESVNLAEVMQAHVPGCCRLGLGFSDRQVARCHVDDVGTIFLMNSSSDLSSWLRKLFFWKGVSEQTSSHTDTCVVIQVCHQRSALGWYHSLTAMRRALPMFKV